MLPRAVRLENRLNAWKMKPMQFRRTRGSSASPRRVTSRPQIRTTPVDGRSMQPITDSSVVLPLPDGPMTIASSPAEKSTLTSASAATGAAVPYTFETACRETCGDAATVAISSRTLSPDRSG